MLPDFKINKVTGKHLQPVCITLLSFLVLFSTTYLSKKQPTHLNPDSVGEQQQLELMEFWKCEQQEEKD